MDAYLLDNIFKYLMDVIIVIVAFLALIGSIHHRVKRNKGLYNYQIHILIAATTWIGVLIFIIWNQHMFGQADAVKHEAYAHEICGYIDNGDFDSLMIFARPGNNFFRMLAGFYFYVTGAEGWTVRFLGLLTGLAGVICILDIVVRVNNGRRVSTLLALTILCLPSLIFWSNDFIKDGFTLGCNCFIAQLLLQTPRDSSAKPISVMSAWVALVFLTFLRPHHAIAWYAGLALGPAIAAGKFMRAAGYVVLGSSCVFLLYLVIPGVIDNMLDEGATTTLSSEFEARSDMGGSSIGGKPIPFVTGAYLVFFRPLPGEVPGMVGLVSSLEAMYIGLISLYSVFRIKSYRVFLRSQEMMGCLVVVIMYCGLLSYVYNIGLLVRIRISVLPAIFIIIIPLCAGGIFRERTIYSKKKMAAFR